MAVSKQVVKITLFLICELETMFCIAGFLDVFGVF